jgi:toxin-antitoxin system PIN domain toxin
MRALLDVNVLIALLDAEHMHHRRAYAWFVEHVPYGWASCPLTQNGCIRIMSQSRYSKPLPAAAVIERLCESTKHAHHQFWPDDVTLLDETAVDRNRIHGPRQLTDIYLLALAVKHKGRLVTFDGSIPLSAVRGARKDHIAVI